MDLKCINLSHVVESTGGGATPRLYKTLQQRTLRKGKTFKIFPFGNKIEKREGARLTNLSQKLA